MQTIHEKPDDLHPVMDSLGHSSLGKIIRKAKYLLALDHALQTILPPEFANHCRVVNINQAIVILGIDSAAIATRIQMMSEDIVQRLRKNKEFKMVLGIQCKVQAR
ncbi:MAG: hypothetical protein A3E82_08340 [Gammaproteobacteria bacterium RIFCSPHIGHO2_12_FULL_38_11]|nr:MAG: hypothetical protein A3E82_08340 [Gammaproteobacteria bacterium RIFCSPHIGHO2_12_FULL_38_11]